MKQNHLERLALILLCVSTLLFPAAVIYAGAVIDRPNVRITDAGLGDLNSAEWPDLVVQDNTVYATWLDDRHGNDNAVFFARSTDGGVTWSENILVSALPYDDWAEHPQIAVQPDGTLWIVWYLYYAENSNKVNDLRIARSTDDGITWERFNLKDGTGHNDLWKTRIAADADHVYVLFHDYKSTDTDEGYNIVLYTVDPATLDIRETQANDVARSGRINDSLLDDGPHIDFALRETALGTVMCAVWEDQRDRFAVYGACSTDSGATFGTNFAISPADGVSPQLALASDGTLYATYALDTDASNNIWMRRSTDLGEKWSGPQQVTNLESGDVWSWDLAVDSGGQIVLPWIHGGYGQSNLNLNTSSDGGNNFATLVDIEDDQGKYPTVSSQTQIDVALGPSAGGDERVYLVWRDDRNVQREIWSVTALLDGTPPTTPTNVRLQSTDSALFLAWDSATDANGVAGYRVYRATAADGPFTLLSPQLVQAVTYVDVGLTTGETYFYQIAAVDGTGNQGTGSAVVSGHAITTDAQPTGVLLYEVGNNLRLRPLAGGDEQTLTDAYDPILATDGTQLYYRNSQTINVRSITTQGVLGTPATYLTRDGMFDFDIAADNIHFGIIATRSQFNTGSGICIVSEPTYGTTAQDLFTDQYNYSTYVAISADHRWMTYRYDGFCNAVSFGYTEPGDFCIANLSTQEFDCVKGADINGADFAPTGSNIVFAAPFSGQHEVWRAQVTNEGDLVNYAQLTRGPANQPVDNPRWSSDGNWIVFQRDIDPDTADDAQDWRLFAVRADGTTLRDLGISGEEPALLGGGSEGGAGLPVPVGNERVYLPLVTR